MKKTNLVLLFAIFSVLFTSCSSSPVKSTGDKFMDALVSSDEEALKSIVSEQFYSDIDDVIKGTSQIKDLDDFKFTYSGSTVSEDGEYAVYTANTYLSYGEVVEENKVSIYFKKNGENWIIVNIE